ncbi:ASCH domain-containing protein [Moraxella nasovis]|uniref:ASCH domain-containing protein n=1 Tax=Moraxella nasovis TaxID=2904121 RepID=UPI001F60BF97|nr:ASCH domain-containing protein [Moraxella nasovis]UNU72969.1 ASCH domain-containing protein [Moraxella nasovis]
MININDINITTLPHSSFGDSPKLADELVELVIQGKKTATCGSLVEHLQDPAPPTGSLQVITDGQDRPRCVIQSTHQFIIRFCDVDENLAKLEGEGDLSLAYWQQAHREFFGRLGVFDDKMWLLFEKFTVIKILENS